MPAPSARARMFVDYTLQRRATLEALHRGRATSNDVCDAHPHLLLAARHHGETSARVCPVCGATGLRLLRYVYSDELGQYSGRIRTASEVVAMAGDFGHLKVYVVEVCRSCGWNHLVASYVVGDGTPRRPPRRQPTVEEDWG